MERQQSVVLDGCPPPGIWASSEAECDAFVDKGARIWTSNDENTLVSHLTKIHLKISHIACARGKHSELSIIFSSRWDYSHSSFVHKHFDAKCRTTCLLRIRTRTIIIPRRRACEISLCVLLLHTKWYQRIMTPKNHESGAKRIRINNNNTNNKEMPTSSQSKQQEVQSANARRARTKTSSSNPTSKDSVGLSHQLDNCNCNYIHESRQSNHRNNVMSISSEQLKLNKEANLRRQLDGEQDVTQMEINNNNSKSPASKSNSQLAQKIRRSSHLVNNNKQPVQIQRKISTSTKSPVARVAQVTHRPQHRPPADTPEPAPPPSALSLSSLMSFHQNSHQAQLPETTIHGHKATLDGRSINLGPCHHQQPISMDSQCVHTKMLTKRPTNNNNANCGLLPNKTFASLSALNAQFTTTTSINSSNHNNAISQSSLAATPASSSSNLNDKTQTHNNYQTHHVTAARSTASSTAQLHPTSHSNPRSQTMTIKRKVNLKYVKMTIIICLAIDLAITVFVHQFAQQDLIGPIWFTSLKMRFSLLNLVLSSIWFVILLAGILFDLYPILLLGCIIDLTSFLVLFGFTIKHFTKRIDYNTVNLTSLLGLLFSIIILHVYLLVTGSLTAYLALLVRRRNKQTCPILWRNHRETDIV